MKHMSRLLVLIAAITVAALVAGFTYSPARATPAYATPTYVAQLAPGGSVVTAHLTGARFAPTPVGGQVAILDRAGGVLEQVALVTELNGVAVPLRVSVGADRSTATFTPLLSDAMLQSIRQSAHPVSAKKDKAYMNMMWHLNNGWNRGNAAVTTAVGALIGFAVGFLLIGGWLITTPIGAAIGAAVGINAGDPKAGQSVLDWINTP